MEWVLELSADIGSWTCCLTINTERLTGTVSNCSRARKERVRLVLLESAQLHSTNIMTINWPSHAFIMHLIICTTSAEATSQDYDLLISSLQTHIVLTPTLTFNPDPGNTWHFMDLHLPRKSNTLVVFACWDVCFLTALRTKKLPILNSGCLLAVVCWQSKPLSHCKAYTQS